MLQWICNKADWLDDAGKPMDKALPPSVFSEARGEPEMRRESAFEEARGMIGPAAWSVSSVVSWAACEGAADPCIAYGGWGAISADI